MTAEFLVVGESVADIVRAPGRPEVTHPGGSPANVAYGLALLGAGRTALLTELGDDAAGRLIADRLLGAGVELHADRRGPGPTPSAVVTLDEDGKATYAFDIRWTLAPDRAEVACAPRHLHFGSIAAFAEPGAGTVFDLVRKLRGRATVSYDPNVRADLLGGRAEAVAKAERCVALADVVKASDEDLHWLYPGRDEADVAAAWLAAGPAFVLVTRGAGGAACYRRDAGALLVAAPWVEVADTVGAGDAFMSATLAALAAEQLLGVDGRAGLAAMTDSALSRVLGYAIAAATLAVSRPGANPPSAAELRELRR
jgi:fructokinase